MRPGKVRARCGVRWIRILIPPLLRDPKLVTWSVWSSVPSPKMRLGIPEFSGSSASLSETFVGGSRIWE